MQHQNLFVFDIETIPDTAAVHNLTGSDSRDVETLREELANYHLEVTDGKNSFPRQPFQKVVAVSYLEAEIYRHDDGSEGYALKNLGSGQREDEAGIVQGFFEYLQRIKPRLVSYNGRGFDLPVLKYRAMAHGVAAKWFYDSARQNKWENYQSRYSSDWHCDLLEVLSEFGASSRVKLNEVCAILGFPGKFGVDGSKVAGMHDAGQLQEIRQYCETDVLNTYLVYLRLMQHQGRISTKSYNRAIADVISFIESQSDERPYLGDFLAAWGEASNNSFMLEE